MTNQVSDSNQTQNFAQQSRLLYPGPWGPYPGPWNPYPGPWDPFPGRDSLLALSIGQLHGKEFRNAVEKFKAVGEDRKRYRKSVLKELANTCQITDTELEQLYIVLDLVIEFDKKPSDSEEIHRRVRHLHHKLIDQNSSPVTIALTGVAVDSTSRSAIGPIAEADFAGAAAGGLIGSAFPGLGTLIGVLVGAAIASIEVGLDNKV